MSAADRATKATLSRNTMQQLQDNESFDAVAVTSSNNDCDDQDFVNQNGIMFGSAQALLSYCFESMFLTVDPVVEKKYYLKTMVHNEFGQWRCLSIYFDPENRLRKFSMLNADTAFTQAALLSVECLIGLKREFFEAGFLPQNRNTYTEALENKVDDYFASLQYGMLLEQECSNLAEAEDIPFYGLTFDKENRKVHCSLGERDKKFTLSFSLKKSGEIYSIRSLKPTREIKELIQRWQVTFLGRKVLGRSVMNRSF